MTDDVTLFLCGDVMLGRGIDQVLPHPGDATLWESHLRDARTYVELAERRNGPVPRPVDWSWPWGHVVDVLERERPHVRLVNLETSVTRSDDVAPGKAVHYRMHPDNLSAVTVVAPDVCVLANNHVLDFGPTGLVETLDVLHGAGLRTAGAGRDRAAAWRPAIVELGAGRRLLVLAVGTPSSGVPTSWAAGLDRPGVAVVPRLTPAWANAVLTELDRVRRPGDLAVVSVHWGSNWGHAVDRDQVAFGHALVDGGVDLVHGHSSHHPRPVEVYRDRLVLHGCGDLVNDYEGITGREAYRSELRLMYLATLDAATGRLRHLRMMPLRARRLRLDPASAEEAGWLAGTLARTSRPFGTEVVEEADGTLVVPG